jgi:hypothetical protein
MKKFFFSSVFFFYLFIAHALDLEAGLWKIQSTVEMDGKKYDPQNEYKKMLSAVPADQRKKVEEALQKSLKKQQMSLNNDGSYKICLSLESLKNPQAFTPQDKNCTFKVQEKSKKILRTLFSCKNDSSGSWEWKALDRKNFQSIRVNKNQQGYESKMIGMGKFMSSSCGSLKAIKSL